MFVRFIQTEQHVQDGQEIKEKHVLLIKQTQQSYPKYDYILL